MKKKYILKINLKKNLFIYFSVDPKKFDVFHKTHFMTLEALDKQYLSVFLKISEAF
jgi:hypothetical protein